MIKYFGDLILLIVIALSFGTCHTKCRKPKPYILSVEMEKYFGSYQEGNYWVYENEEKTKLDSFYISDYEEVEGVNTLPECHMERYRRFKLNNSFFSKTDFFNVEYKNNGNCCSYAFMLRDNYDQYIFLIEENSKIKDFSLDDLKELESLIIRDSSYSNVLEYIGTESEVGTKIYFAPNIGIVRYENKNGIFSLIRNRIN
ncbi:MAG TPA: hypothetical protein ENI82_03625 [Bacteroidetes bacterium]|nr:hypothetical protein [Bacteroidota bacterium]